MIGADRDTMKLVKKKVFFLRYDVDKDEVVFDDFSGIITWIENDEHKEGVGYKYTINVGWLTQEDIDNLPKTNF